MAQNLGRRLLAQGRSRECAHTIGPLPIHYACPVRTAALLSDAHSGKFRRWPGPSLKVHSQSRVDWSLDRERSEMLSLAPSMLCDDGGSHDVAAQGIATARLTRIGTATFERHACWRVRPG